MNIIKQLLHDPVIWIGLIATIIATMVSAWKPRKGHIAKVADRYEREYGFMALNAVIHNAQILYKGNALWTIEDELKQVHDELLRRGLKIITTKEEYEAGVKLHGVPQSFKGRAID